MARLTTCFATLAIGIFVPLTAQAQQITPGSAPRQERVTWEIGQDVHMGKPGGLATYFGVAQGNNLAAFRMGFLDATNTVPCSVGVMYQFIAHATSSFRIKPTASASLARVFSCASDKDPRQGSPDTNGAMTGAGGVRISTLRGRHIAASFDLMGYVERRTSASHQADPLSKGVMVGIAIHGARR